MTDLFLTSNLSLTTIFLNLPFMFLWLITVVMFFLLDIYLLSVSYFNSKHSYISSLNKNTDFLNSLVLLFQNKNLSISLKNIYSYAI